MDGLMVAGKWWLDGEVDSRRYSWVGRWLAIGPALSRMNGPTHLPTFGFDQERKAA